MKKIISKLFGPKNKPQSGSKISDKKEVSATDTPTGKSEIELQQLYLSHEERFKNWLAHPDQYGTPPSSIERVLSDLFYVRFIPGDSRMDYSIFKYTMPNSENEAYGIVDEVSTFSFLSKVDYGEIEFEELEKAYVGKLCEFLNCKMQEALGTQSIYTEAEEQVQVKQVLQAKGVECQVLETYNFNNIIVFFTIKISENGGRAFCFSGHVNIRKQEYFLGDPILPKEEFLKMSMYLEIAKIMAMGKPL